MLSVMSKCFELVFFYAEICFKFLRKVKKKYKKLLLVVSLISLNFFVEVNVKI